MRKKKHCVDHKNLVVPFPIIQTMVWYLFLDRISAPQWLWGAMGLLLGIVWLIHIIEVFTVKQVLHEPVWKNET